MQILHMHTVISDGCHANTATLTQTQTLAKRMPGFTSRLARSEVIKSEMYSWIWP